MVIVHLITRWLKAGSEENTLETVRAQRAEGHRVLLLYGVEHDVAAVARAAQHVETLCVPGLIHAISPLSDGRTIADLAKLFRRLKPDVVHTHQSKAGILGRVAARLAGVPVIVHGVHILPWMHVGPLQRAVYLAAERLCAPLTDAYVDVSPGVREENLRRGIGSSERHFVAYSAMDVARFKAALPPEDWRSLLAVGPVEPKPTTILMVAAFEARKRHTELIGALAGGLRARPELRLLFAGEGPGLGAAKRQVTGLGLERQICFAGYRPDPERLVALADVCVLTSSREGLPRVVVQYAAAGKAIVLTRLPGIEDIIVPGVSALVTDTIDEAAERALELVDDVARRNVLAQAARAVDVDRWSPERMQAEMSRAYAAGFARADKAGRSRSQVANVGAV